MNIVQVSIITALLFSTNVSADELKECEKAIKEVSVAYAQSIIMNSESETRFAITISKLLHEGKYKEALRKLDQVIDVNTISIAQVKPGNPVYQSYNEIKSDIKKHRIEYATSAQENEAQVNSAVGNFEALPELTIEEKIKRLKKLREDSGR